MGKNKIKMLNKLIIFNTSKVKIKVIIKVGSFKALIVKKERIKNMMRRKKSCKRIYLLKRIKMIIITY